MEKIIIYVLTHKKFNEEYDKDLYKPLLNGSYFISEPLDYIKDDTGDNISKLNPYYAELTGEYWAWKNSDADIIGFNHYRRWFARNLKFDKLTKEDILNDLKTNDIILPQKSIVKKSVKTQIIKGLEKYPDYGAKWEDYVKLGNILKEDFPEYYETFNKIMNGNKCYSNNMFICNSELADKYFSWLFKVIDKLEPEIDFSKYPENNKRIFGFFSETLLTVFVEKHNLKVKEHYLVLSERKIPLIHVLQRRFPIFGDIENIIAKILP